jgi:hypothetical protein
MSDKVQPAVYSDAGCIIKYSQSAQRFCEAIAVQVRRLTGNDRANELTAYRVHGVQVAELV